MTLACVFPLGKCLICYPRSAGTVAWACLRWAQPLSFPHLGVGVSSFLLQPGLRPSALLCPAGMGSRSGHQHPFEL